jgi:nucleoside-diphosphate-sugar epimerase
MKKILITGSSGFLGSHCVRYFQSQNHNVIGVDLIAAPTTTHIMDVCDFVNKTKSKFD